MTTIPNDNGNLTAAFLHHWRALGGPELDREVALIPGRRFRADFCHRLTRVAIELEGGTFQGGRHTRGTGYARDCQKYNLMQLAGWRVFRFTTDMLRDDPAGHLQPVIDLIKAAGL